MKKEKRAFESPLSELSIFELQEQMTSGHTTARQLVERYSTWIRALDRRRPGLAHVLEINPDAHLIADQLDRERCHGQFRGPLHGIPILIKDNIATSDRMETTAGSLALLGVRPPRDAGVVRRLRDAGVILLGKTNMSEWANFRSGLSTSGWSARGGQTRNPYALDRSPSGSSSGSAVAVAASSCAAAVGTETIGSIISPASVCGIVGLKPTVGLISRSGIIPISHSQDTAGPMARTVADAAALLTAMAGSDPSDEATADADRRRSDYTSHLQPEGLKAARIGVLRGASTNPQILAVYDQALALLSQRGAVLSDPLTLEGPGGIDLLLEYEFKADIERYLREWAPTSPLKTIDDLIAFNQRESIRELVKFGQDTFEAAARRGPLTSPEYVELKERLQRISREGIDGIMNANQLDALVAVSSGPARLIDLVSGDAGSADGAPDGTAITAIAGYPHITVPMGFVHGLPLGLSFFGRAWSEATLLKLAFAYEQASQMRRPPAFAETVDVPRNGT